MNELKKEFEVKNFIITPESISKFEIMENRRAIGDGHVGQIHAALMRGRNPMGVIIVNETSQGKWRLIDGNHRVEAVKRFYAYKKDNQKIKVECVVRIYKNLSPDEERETYSDEAKRKNESHEDRLNMYKDTINFWKMTQDPFKEFPCKVSIYQQKKSLRLRTILDSLCTVKSEMSNGYYPKYLRKQDLVLFARDCDYDDFLLMKKFLTIFQEVFGEMSSDNVLTRRIGFIPLFDIFYKNFRTSQNETVRERFTLIMGKSDIMMYLNMQGREAQQMVRDLMVNYMNKGKMYSRNAVM